MLHKLASKFGHQWGHHLHVVLWAYCNIPYDATGEKPSYMLFGCDLRTPTEAALMPPHTLDPQDVQDYREEVIMSLSSARDLAVKALSLAHSNSTRLSAIEQQPWITVWETGKLHIVKLSNPWHSPYRVVEWHDPDLTSVYVYRSQDGQIHVYQSCISPCPMDLPPGYYWYCDRQPGSS